MRIVQINAVPYGSTGRIMFQLADALEAEGNKVLCTAGFTWRECRRDDFFLTSNIFEKTLHTCLAKITGRIGCYSRGATRRLLKRLDEFRPDLIHLHNLHCWFINLPMLFDYLKTREIPVVWTFHDCWPFTGHCPHFDGIGCEKWRTGCSNCAQYRQYPQTYFDCSKTMYRLKREWFTGVKDLTIVTPSRWLAVNVERSFLKDYPVQVIPNGVDLSVFRPMDNRVKDEFRIGNRYLVLGVSYAWDYKKGLDVFIELARRLGDEYRIMLVGTDETTDRLLPPEIISVHRTENPEALARLYSGADVFVNPTREENFPTVNMEALACGTPVITFDTGGSPEIPDAGCGVVVPKNDIDGLEAQIRRVCTEHYFSLQACRGRGEQFPQEQSVRQYLSLYRRKL